MDFNIIIEKGEDGYLLAEVIELPGCHTQARDINELILRTKEAISLWIDVHGKNKKVKNSFIGIQKLEV